MRDTGSAILKLIFCYFGLLKHRDLKITFLGTGTSMGIPVIGCNCNTCLSGNQQDKRLRSSILVEVNGLSIVIDAGPDFRQQMLQAKVRNLDAILITHEHKDHVGGIDDVRAFNYISRKAVDIYCDISVNRAIKSEYRYVFNGEGYPGIPRMNIKLITKDPFTISGTEIIPVLAYHHELPVFGFRIDKFSYLTDANMIPDESMSLLEGSRIMVINALRKEKHLSHFSLDEALDVIAHINPEKAYITHIGHEMGLHAEVSRELPGNVELAYDGLILDLD